MSNRPTQSHFMSHTYEIEWVPQESIEVEGGRCWGLTEHAEHRIRIEDTMPQSREREVLLHEVLHQMFMQSGLPLSHEEEEAVVRFFGGALIHHLDQNPKFWRYISSRKHKPKVTND